MPLKIYIYISMFLMGIDSTIVVAWQVLTRDFDFVPALMISLWIVSDFIFVALNIKKIQFNYLQMYLVSWVALGFIVGIFNVLLGDPAFVFDRVIKDTVPPILFVMKFCIAKKLFDIKEFEYKSFVFFALVISFLNVFIFYSLGGADNLYVGLTPPTNPVLAGAAAYSSVSLFAVGLILIVYSGKRAHIVAAIFFIVSLFVMVVRSRSLVRRKVLLRMLASVVACVVIGLNFQGGVAMIDKFNNSITGSTDSSTGQSIVSLLADKSLDLDDEGVRTALFIATAGRSAEVLGVIDVMTPLSWIIGKGAGFTYSSSDVDNNIKERYSNVHFSPLGLAYKYGILFAIIFYWWLVRSILRAKNNSAYFIYWKGISILLLVQSLFAFNLFVEFLLPLALAALNARK
jgi:hypothetical protein